MEDFASMHWSALKKLMEDRGLKYEGKEQAIAVLSAGQASPDGEAAKAPPAGTVTPNPAPTPSRAREFDRSQPFGHVSGEVDGAPGACYAQDGHLFNSEGEKVG